MAHLMVVLNTNFAMPIQLDLDGDTVSNRGPG